MLIYNLLIVFIQFTLAIWLILHQDFVYNTLNTNYLWIILITKW